MPVSGPKDYLPVLDAFIAHWTLVNAALGATPLLLQGGYALATLTADRAALAAQLAAVEQNNNNAQAASTDRDLKRANLRERMRQFNQTVRGLLPRSIYGGMLPRIPNATAAPGLWMRALDDMAHVWNRVNTDAPPPAGFTPPLLLVGGYTRANFVTEQTALSAAFTAIANTSTNAEAARDLRDQIFTPLNARLVQYRAAVQGRFPAGHALIKSLPALRNSAGSTPDPVTLSGNWDPTVSKARLAYTASANPALLRYELRVVFGPAYRAAEETFVASNVSGSLEFLTDTGLAASGSVASYKVYVVLSTGNERGSNAVKITRP